MFSLAQLMYATSEAVLEAAKMEFFAADDDSDEFLSPSRRYRQRIEKFLQRGDEWLNVRRQHVFTRGSNTNNYSEATMRILKDIILGRTKAFNVVALVDFCSTVLQSCKAITCICTWPSNRPQVTVQRIVFEDA